MEKRRVRLNINGVVCGVITNESGEYMQTLADEVGGLMGHAMSASPLITREAAALTAALSLCDDYHKTTDRAQALAERVEELEVEAELWQEEKVELLKSAVDTQKDAQLAEKAARLESENGILEENIQRLKVFEEKAAQLEEENAALRQAAENPGPTPREGQLEGENQELRRKLELVIEKAKQGQEALRQAEAQIEESQSLEGELEALQARLNHLGDAAQENQALKEKLEKLTGEAQAQAESLRQENQALQAKAAQLGDTAQENRELRARLEELEKLLSHKEPQTPTPRQKEEPKPEPTPLVPEPPAKAPTQEEPPQKPKPPKRRRNPLRFEDDLQQEGLVSFFEKDE